MMNKRHTIALLFLMLTVRLYAASADSTLIAFNSLWNTVRQPAWQNPALHGKAFQSSLTQLYVAADWQKQSEAFIPEKGKGFLLPAAHADTYLRLSERTAVWGHASYMNGKHNDICWNSTSDYDLLQPHILADSVGGDTDHERYVFEGGYATQLNQWLLGAEMLFRADHEYRDIDPRMRGIVNELTIRLGAGYEAIGYHWAAAVEGNVYKQSNSVDFYRELGVSPEYQMTGLGTEYARFSGDKLRLHYQGGGARLLLDVVPVSERGFYVHLDLNEHRYHRQITENYTLPLTDLYSQGVNTVIGWEKASRPVCSGLSSSRPVSSGPSSSRSVCSVPSSSRPVCCGTAAAVYASLDYEKRSGDERIIGTSASTAFPELGVLTMYKNNRLNTSLTGLYGTRQWLATASVGYQNNHQEYVYPERKLNVAHLYGRIEGQLFWNLADRLLLTCGAKVSYFAGVNDELVMPFANMRPAFVDKMTHQYEYAKANYTGLSAQVRGDYQLKSIGLFAELGGGYTACSVGEHQADAHLAFGITF